MQGGAGAGSTPIIPCRPRQGKGGGRLFVFAAEDQSVHTMRDARAARGHIGISEHAPAIEMVPATRGGETNTW